MFRVRRTIAEAKSRVASRAPGSDGCGEFSFSASYCVFLRAFCVCTACRPACRCDAVRGCGGGPRGNLRVLLRYRFASLEHRLHIALAIATKGRCSIACGGCPGRHRQYPERERGRARRGPGPKSRHGWMLADGGRSGEGLAALDLRRGEVSAYADRIRKSGER